MTGTNIIWVMGTNIITNWPHTGLVTNLNADMVDGLHATQLGGVINHDTLLGLGDDDHTQYVIGTGDTMTGNLTMQSPAVIQGIGIIDSAEITDGTIAADDIATGAVGSDEIAAGAVGGDEIAADAVGSDEIAQGATQPDSDRAGHPYQLALNPEKRPCRVRFKSS